MKLLRPYERLLLVAIFGIYTVISAFGVLLLVLYL